jgi:regulator of sigma E protease
MFVIVFILVLSLLVLIHEFGHYITAKWFKIKVEEFGYGFPPRAWGKKIGETLYSINWLPVGGFVKLYGEDEVGGGKIGKGKNEAYEHKDIKHAFFAKPAWQRATVVVAGVVMNLLLAVVIYYVYLFVSNFSTVLQLYPHMKDPHFYFVNQETRQGGLIISDVVKDSPAEKAGITSQTRVLSLNGQPLPTNPEKVSDYFSKTIMDNKGKPVNMEIEDVVSGTQRTITLTPRVNPPKGQGAIGVKYGYEIPMIVLRYDTPAQKAFSGVSHTINLTKYNIQIFGKIFDQSVKKKSVKPLGETVSGPLAILFLFQDIFKLPSRDAILNTLNIAGLISVSLALFNILPIPALDGGRLFFILYEMVTKRKVSPKIEGMVHAVGMVLLLLLILLVTARDIITRFFS